MRRNESQDKNRCPDKPPPRNKAEYEQAPWNQAHIEALYGNLRGRIIADGH